MLILSAELGLQSAQADITAAFVHATLAEDECIYVRQPRGFVGDPAYCYTLKHALYGLLQAPCYFFEYLKKRIELCGAKQVHLDPCLFIRPNIIAITYVNDLLIYSKDDKHIKGFFNGMKNEKVDLRKEGMAEGFLGVDIQHDNKPQTITLTQSGLTQRVITALGLCSSNSVKCDTPTETAALPKDADGAAASGMIGYPCVVRMLLYLSGHSRPDISFAVHQCSRYTFQPKLKKHEIALKRIGLYLKGTADKGLIIKPANNMGIECYPDADFAGLWGHENPHNPHCAHSRTGFVICVAEWPVVVWISKLQTEITLSTMEAEYVAMSMACKTLFPIVNMLVRDLGEKLGLEVDDKTVKIHEDNVGVLTLGKLEPRRMTPRSKHCAIKYHWFHEKIGPRRIRLQKINTKQQLGDIFTKGLGPIMFRQMREKLMGW